MFPLGLSSRIIGLFLRLRVDTGKVSRSTPAVEVAQSWNNANETFIAKSTAITDNGSGINSLAERITVNGNVLMSLSKLAKFFLSNTHNAGSSLSIDFGGGGVYRVYFSASSDLILQSNSTTVSLGSASVQGLWFDRQQHAKIGVNGTIYDDALGDVILTARNQLPSATVNLKGRSVYLTAGNGASGSSGAAHGGDVVLVGGTGYGTGTKGIVTASRLRADGFSTAFAAKTADYTSTPDDGTLTFDASGGARVNTLETAVGAAGRIKVVAKIDASANTVTIDPNASETINGAATLVLSAQWDVAVIQSNGSNWIRIA